MSDTSPLRPFDRPLLVFCGVCVVLGVLLRAQELGFPAAFNWDEHHFVINARNYLAGERDWNDHPPLGKLLMAAAMKVLGDKPAAWRLAPLLCGVVNIGLAGLIGARLFRSSVAGLLATFFVAIDGFLIAYSRAALLDGMLVTFILATFACIVCFRGPLRLVLAGVLLGCAMAIKTSGVTLLAPLAVATWLAVWRKSWGEAAAAVAAWVLAPLVFLAWMRLGLWWTKQPSTWHDAVSWVETTTRNHASATDWTHPLVSRWYTWVVPIKPIVLRSDAVGTGWVRVLTTLGNPLLWWGSVLAVVGSAVWLLRSQTARLFSLLRNRVSAWQRRSRQRGTEASANDEEPAPPSALASGSAWLLTIHLAALSPWILTNRDSYIYHYLPSYTVGLILLAGWVAAVYRRPRARLAVLAAVVLVANVSAWYAPLWGQLPISPKALEARPLWRG